MQAAIGDFMNNSSSIHNAIDCIAKNWKTHKLNKEINTRIKITNLRKTQNQDLAEENQNFHTKTLFHIKYREEKA